MTTRTTRRARIEGGVYGLLVGDALGVPYEFHRAETLPPPAEIDYEPPPGFRRAHPSAPAGTWSDDGAQALCLLASLLERGALDVEDLGRRLVDWYERGYLAVDNEVFDVGIQTRTALEAIRAGVPALAAGPSGERDNGNGALMRVLPLALWHRGDDGALARDAALQSRVTHGHVRSQVCCAIHCLWARRVLDGERDPWAAAVAAARGLWPVGSDERRELDEVLMPDAPPARGPGSGYVLHTLRAARWAVAEGGDYAGVVRAAISLGDDTDTTACVAGGIAGLRDGIDGIPARWRRDLRGRELVEPLVAALVRREDGA
jgi:ADP-ribosylglycohydrolase